MLLNYNSRVSNTKLCYVYGIWYGMYTRTNIHPDKNSHTTISTINTLKTTFLGVNNLKQASDVIRYNIMH